MRAHQTLAASFSLPSFTWHTDGLIVLRMTELLDAKHFVELRCHILLFLPALGPRVIDNGTEQIFPKSTTVESAAVGNPRRLISALRVF